MYFYPLIHTLKKKYRDRFGVTNQYNDKLLRMGINTWCNDLTRFLLKQVAELTVNGNQVMSEINKILAIESKQET